MLIKNQILSDGLVLQTVRTLKGLEPHAEAWNNLALQSPHQLPDPSYAWSASYLEHQLESSESWFCLFAYDRFALVGVLPVVVTPLKRMGLNCKQFRAPYNDQTASIDFLVQPGREAEIIPLFLSQFNQIDPDWFCFEMRHLPDCSPTLALMNRGLKKMKSVGVFDGWGCFVRVQGSFENFKKRLRPGFKRQLRKYERKFLALPGAKISLVSGEDLSERDLVRFMQVESLSWKFTKGSAICQSDSLVSFYKTLTGRLAGLGWLEWQFLEAEGKTIAAILTIRINRSLVALKICYDEAYAALSPGTLLFSKTLERAFSGGQVDEVNCLTDYPWFHKWPMEKRSYFNYFIFPCRLFSILTGYLSLKARLGSRQIFGIRRLYDDWMNRFKDSGQKRTQNESE
jgi:hypothetical protein